MRSRQQQILEAIIFEHFSTAQPVGSEALVEDFNFNFSPATIRSEMLDLTQQGFLFQPYTSAGRLPTDKGYRFFVNELMKEKNLTPREQKILKKIIKKLLAEHSRWMKEITKEIAHFSRNFGFGAFEDKDFFGTGLSEVLKEPEFEDINSAKGLFEFLDEATSHPEDIFEKIRKDFEVFIGSENPVRELKNFSTIIAKYSLPSGKKTILGIIGPKRMNYPKNVSLLKYIGQNL